MGYGGETDRIHEQREEIERLTQRLETVTRERDLANGMVGKALAAAQAAELTLGEKMRTFRWCRQELAESCQKQDDHVHIVIASPGGRCIRLDCRRTTLRLYFHDLDPEAIKRTRAAHGDWEKAQEIIDNCFTEEHAGHIELFVRTTDPADVIVNCEAGISRSPGVVLALRRRFGGDTEECYKTAHPNIHVASVLGKVLGVGPFAPNKVYDKPDFNLFS